MERMINLQEIVVVKEELEDKTSLVAAQLNLSIHATIPGNIEKVLGDLVEGFSFCMALPFLL